MPASLKIVIAPDKFKGSLSGPKLAAAIEQGFRREYPDAAFVVIPVADGGDGTMDALIAATRGRRVARRVTGPDGRPVEGAFGLLGGSAGAVVELAQASGLALLAAGSNDPRTATTFGTGELIGAALDEGARRIVVGIGGSATNDGGSGALAALGAGFLDADGQPLGRGGADLARLARIDIVDLRSRLAGSTIEVATDVRNPLCGPNGASAIYGPQKGADPQMVRQLDAALAHFADIAAAVTGVDARSVPGTGAAGGFGFGFLTFAGAALRDGAELVLSVVGFERRLDGASLVVTGEGRLDRQTLSGKSPYAVAQAARKRGIPAIVVAGAIDCSKDDLDRMGFADAIAATPSSMGLAEGMAQAERLTVEAAAQLARRSRLLIAS